MDNCSIFDLICRCGVIASTNSFRNIANGLNSCMVMSLMMSDKLNICVDP